MPEIDSDGDVDDIDSDSDGGDSDSDSDGGDGGDGDSDDIDSDDIDSDSDDEVRNQRQPLAAASRPEASSSVERFRNSEEAECLAELYMATKGQSPPNSDSQRKTAASAPIPPT